MRKWAYLGGAIAFEVLGTLSLRASVDHAGWIPLTAVAYAAALFLLALTLRERMPIGVAYGIWSAVGVALIAVLGVALFDERLSPARVLGLVVIVAGVVLVETGSRPPAPRLHEQEGAA